MCQPRDEQEHPASCPMTARTALCDPAQDKELIAISFHYSAVAHRGLKDVWSTDRHIICCLLLTKIIIYLVGHWLDEVMSISSGAASAAAIPATVQQWADYISAPVM